MQQTAWAILTGKPYPSPVYCGMHEPAWHALQRTNTCRRSGVMTRGVRVHSSRTVFRPSVITSGRARSCTKESTNWRSTGASTSGGTRSWHACTMHATINAIVYFRILRKHADVLWLCQATSNPPLSTSCNMQVFMTFSRDSTDTSKTVVHIKAAVTTLHVHGPREKVIPPEPGWPAAAVHHADGAADSAA